MTAIIVTGGKHPPFPRVKFLFEQGFPVLAADSGFDYLYQHQIACDYFIGDADSSQIFPQVLKPILKAGSHYKKNPLLPSQDRIFLFPKDKDQTDTELGLLWAQNTLEATKIILIGGGGGDLAHKMALLFMYHKIYPDLWITEQNFSTAVGLPPSSSPSKRHGTLWENSVVPDELCSIFGVGQGPWEIASSQGFFWPLHSVQFPQFFSLHNRFTHSKAQFKTKSGIFLLIRYLSFLNGSII